jgi:arylsulfatase A-like enzyme
MRYLRTVILLLLALVASVPSPAQSVRPPNVLLILSDDQGTLDLNIYGSADLYTPNLDALARSGTRFTQFYVAAPVCSPSRAALLTGRVPQRAGVPGNVGLTAPGLPPEQVTIAEMLKPLGYRTGIIGKWHLGHVLKDGPLDQGFDYFFGHKRGCIDNYSHFFYWNGPNEHDLWRNQHEIFEDGTHFSDLMVRETKEFLANNREEPFFTPTQHPRGQRNHGRADGSDRRFRSRRAIGRWDHRLLRPRPARAR